MLLNAYTDNCIYCFATLEKGRCPACKQKEKTKITAGALPPRSFLAGNYLISGVLGMGGFGITYLALDIRFKRKVAIKEYFPAKAKRGSDYSVSVPLTEQLEFNKGIKGFIEEAKNMAELKPGGQGGEYNANLRGVVAVLDFFNENNTAYIVMEYLDGITLKDYVKKSGGKLHIAEALSILAPVFQSLQEIHARGIIHRDISPDNIIITNRGAKLIDYGASCRGGKRLDITIKRHFAPPEQYRRGYQDARTDIYALGVCVYYCVTGKLPPESIKRMEKETLIAPARLSKISKNQDLAIIKAMSLFPTDRYDNVQDFVDELMV